MRYKDFIEDNFLIDEPETGKLVPFRFNKVQTAYYLILKALGIEKGISVPLREWILKARREGFSSMILALFAADDILQESPTETLVISYKDEATNTFRKRYRRFVLSYYAQKSGVSLSQIQTNPNILETFAKQAFSIDSSDYELRHNQAHFYCGTASARTGGRGGVLQKLLFTEPAHYPDTEKITAEEIVEGTMRQVDKNTGWVFQESTANGVGNYYHRTYEAIKKGVSRFVKRFFGWREMYSEEEMKVIRSEFTDPDMAKQEYPETEEEAFLASNINFTNADALLDLVGAPADKSLHSFIELGGVNYIDQAEIMRDYLIMLTRTIPNRELYIGIDSAKDYDRTVLTVLVGTGLSMSGGIKCVSIDATGAGDYLPDWFERNTKWYIHRVKFSSPTKSIMYKNLQTVILDRRTTLPEYLNDTEFTAIEWRHFHKQMCELQKKIVGQLLIVAHPKGDNRSGTSDEDYERQPHDDYPDSWALAELGFITINGLPKGQRPPEEKSSTEGALRRLLESKGRSRRSGRVTDDV